MSLYLPAAFACEDRSTIARLIAEHPFATLVTARDEGLAVTHLPLILLPDREPHGTIIGHVARANPHWQYFAQGKTVAIFQGPHHYISPAWYQNQEGAVPTWNYAVVHCHGHPETIESEAEIDAVLDFTVRHFEAHQRAPWTPELTEAALGKLRQAIIAFRIPIQRVEAKFKLSQNRSQADRQSVAHALSKTESQEARAVAEAMQGLDHKKG